MFAKKFRQHGPIHLSQYLMKVKVGDYVDIFADPSIHKGMPHKGYHGRTGIVFNVTKSAVGVRVNKLVNGRIIEKRIHVRIEHVQHSNCRADFLARRKANDEAHEAAHKSGRECPLISPQTGHFFPRCAASSPRRCPSTPLP